MAHLVLPLSGTIPRELGNLSWVEKIELSPNYLTSEILIKLWGSYLPPPSRSATKWNNSMGAWNSFLGRKNLIVTELFDK